LKSFKRGIANPPLWFGCKEEETEIIVGQGGGGGHSIKKPWGKKSQNSTVDTTHSGREFSKKRESRERKAKECERKLAEKGGGDPPIQCNG